MLHKNDGDKGGLSTLFYRDSRALLLLIGMVVVAGLTAFSVLPRMEDPVLSRRVGLIATPLPGADARRVETLITEPIEDRLQDVKEIKKLNSQSRQGISTITVELRDEITATDEVWSEVRGKINDSLAEMPPEAGRPVFEELDVRAYAIILSLTWTLDDSPTWALLRRYAKQLEDNLQSVNGTEIVDRFADPGEEITVTIDPNRATGLGLSATMIGRQLADSDAKASAGMMRTTNRQYVMEVANQFEQSARIAETLIASNNDGQSVRIGDIADIRRGVPSPMPRYARIDGKPAVSLGVMVRDQERIDLWRLNVQDKIDEFQETLPTGISLDYSLDQNQYVTDRLSSLVGNLILGAAAVVLVIWMLMGLRSALIVALALPLSGFTVLFGLRILGIPIHQMSITGMIIAIGLLIDNAIVAVDEVTAEMGRGFRPVTAVGRVVGHLAIPLAGSTVTTALAFAPIAMMPGPAGEFVGSIAISVILAVTASLFFSLTVIPVLAAKFVRIDAVGVQPNANLNSQSNHLSKQSTITRFISNGISSRRIARGYTSLLSWLMAKPRRAILVSLVLPVTGFFLFSKLPEQFFPAADRDQFYVEIELPSDATISATETASKDVDRILADAGAKKISWFYGESAPVFYYNIVGSRRGVPNFAAAIVQMPTADGILGQIAKLQRKVDQLVPEARVLIRQLEQGPPFTAPIEVRLFGPDLGKLQQYGDQVRSILASLPDVTHTKAMLNETLPTVSLAVDEAATRLVGLKPNDVSSQLYDHLEGARAGVVFEETEQIPVRVRIGNDLRGDLAKIRSLELTSDDGTRVPVSSIADFTLEPQIAVVPRMNRRRMNEVAGYITAGSLPSKSLNEFKLRLDQSDFQLPPGYELEYGGEASQRNDAVGALMANVGMLVVAMIATLVLSFRSFRLAAVILTVAALSTGLGMIGLYFGGYPFGFMAIIGTMGLIGVAINDSIVVLAALQQRQTDVEANDQAMDIAQVVDVTYRCTRHVLATTLTTIAGFTPLIIAGGKFWPPLAIAIAGGVSGATLLALCLVPAVYTLLRCTNRCSEEHSYRPLEAPLALPQNWWVNFVSFSKIADGLLCR